MSNWISNFKTYAPTESEYTQFICPDCPSKTIQKYWLLVNKYSPSLETTY